MQTEELSSACIISRLLTRTCHLAAATSATMSQPMAYGNLKRKRPGPHHTEQVRCQCHHGACCQCTCHEPKHMHGRMENPYWNRNSGPIFTYDRSSELSPDLYPQPTPSLFGQPVETTLSLDRSTGQENPRPPSNMTRFRPSAPGNQFPRGERSNGASINHSAMFADVERAIDSPLQLRYEPSNEMSLTLNHRREP